MTHPACGATAQSYEAGLFLPIQPQSKHSENFELRPGGVVFERSKSRNGYRNRDFDTRVGTIDVAIPAGCPPGVWSASSKPRV